MLSILIPVLSCIPGHNGGIASSPGSHPRACNYVFEPQCKNKQRENLVHNISRSPPRVERPSIKFKPLTFLYNARSKFSPPLSLSLSWLIYGKNVLLGVASKNKELYLISSFIFSLGFKYTTPACSDLTWTRLSPVLKTGVKNRLVFPSSGWKTEPLPQQGQYFLLLLITPRA